MGIRIVLIAAILVGLGIVANAEADITIKDWGFDKDAVGSFPSGFAAGGANSEAGRWEVTADVRSVSPPHFLARIASDKAGTGSQVIFVDGVEAANLDLTVRVQAVSGAEGQGGGVIFRAENDVNYYVAWVSPRDGLLRLDRVVNGEIRPLQDLKVDAEAGKWHTLRLSIRGPLLEAFFDNRVFLSAREDTWEHASYKKGRIGLWARGPGITYFDNIRFTPMDGGTGSAPLGGTESQRIK